MKKVLSMVLALALCVGACLSLSGCADKGADYQVGICQLMVHESLDKATQGFVDGLTDALKTEGKTVEFDTQVAGEANLCTTVVNTFTAKNVDLIMANATPALLAAANATTSIPVLGTSVTDYSDTFSGNIPANVTGTYDAVPFDEQAKMMIDSLKLAEGDKVGVIYCTNESNSLIQYNAVKELLNKEAKKNLLKSKTVNKLGIELTYEIRVKNDDTHFVNQISTTTGVSNAVLVSYNGEYMS